MKRWILLFTTLIAFSSLGLGLAQDCGPTSSYWCSSCSPGYKKCGFTIYYNPDCSVAGRSETTCGGCQVVCPI